MPRQTSLFNNYITISDGFDAHRIMEKCPSDTNHYFININASFYIGIHLPIQRFVHENVAMTYVVLDAFTIIMRLCGDLV